MTDTFKEECFVEEPVILEREVKPALKSIGKKQITRSTWDTDNHFKP